MTKTLQTASLFLTLVVACGCQDSLNGNSLNRAVVNIEDDDPEMNTAVETAQKTFVFFENNWKTMNNDGYSLKFALPTSDGELEHIWFSPTKINGDQVTGQCANDPAKIPGLKLGDTRTVTRSDVSDWMIVVGNRCFGGYTIRVLAKRDPDAATPLEFIDPPAN